MPVASITRIPGHIWIPPTNWPQYKIEIVKPDETTTDVTDRVSDGSIKHGATDFIGDFTFIIENGDNAYKGMWVGNEIVNVYIDYATTATTKRFKGKISKVAYTGNTIKITGRSNAIKFLTITVTKQYTNIESSVILKDLISTYGSGFTSTHVNTSTTNLTVNWYQKPFWDCVGEICKAAGFDCYIDCNDDFHYFEEKSILNEGEAIVHTINLLETGDFGEDYDQIRNRIVVYGQEIEGLPLIYTAEDTDSFDSLGRWQEEIISDTNITTYAQAQERGNWELSVRLVPPITGDITGIGLPTLAPGEMMRISDPDNNVEPKEYKVISFKHIVGYENGIMQTTVTIEKYSIKIPQIFKQTIESSENLSNIANPYELRFSYNMLFTDDTYTESHSNTSLSGGRLISASGSGIWTSVSRTATSNLTNCQLKVSGDGLAGTIYEVSADDGVSWENISVDTSHTFSGTGNKLKLRISINSASTQIISVCLMYK